MWPKHISLIQTQIVNRGQWAPKFWYRNIHKIQIPTKQRLNLAIWNIRTVLDNPSNFCLEEKTALIARQLLKYKMTSTLLILLVSYTEHLVTVPLNPKLVFLATFAPMYEAIGFVVDGYVQEDIIIIEFLTYVIVKFVLSRSLRCANPDPNQIPSPLD